MNNLLLLKMLFFQNNKGKISTNVISTLLLAIIIIIILFEVFAETVPEAQSAGDSMNDTNLCESVGCTYNDSKSAGEKCVNASTEDQSSCVNFKSIPLSGLFGAQSIVFIIIMAALFILVIRDLLKSKK